MRHWPPAAFAPERLFRLLLQRQPQLTLTYRLPTNPNIPLTVRAAPALTLAILRDEAMATEPAILGPARAERAVVAAVLWAPGKDGRLGRAFADGAAAGRLQARYLEPLVEAVYAALAIVCPTYQASQMTDVDGRDGWATVLERGARHGTNGHKTAMLASCVEYVVRPDGVGVPQGRPQWYWDLPVGQLLDGHAMCFAAARAAVQK